MKFVIININSSGSLKGNISYNGSNSIVVSVINLDNKSIHNKLFDNNKYEFNSLASGQYIIWCYESLNTLNKDVYFSGTLSPYKRAARFGFYPDTIEVRARWLIEEVNLAKAKRLSTLNKILPNTYDYNVVKILNSFVPIKLD